MTLKRRNQGGTLSDDATYYLQSGRNRIQYILDNGGGGGIDNVWYGYDDNGNLTFIENFDSGQLHELTYDPSNRLIRVQELGYSDVTDYRISASGWRYWSKAGTANAIYSPRDGSSPLGEFSVGSFPFTWTLRRPDVSVYGRKGFSSNNEFFWTDHLGSVRVRTSNSGSMLEAHDYYPFGLDMPGRSSTGTPIRQGFTGYWRDGESGLGLYYSGARMYSPGTGRFFGVDPLAEEFATWSTYVYVMNNPMSYTDPTGFAPGCPDGKCGMGVYVGVSIMASTPNHFGSFGFQLGVDTEGIKLMSSSQIGVNNSGRGTILTPIVFGVSSTGFNSSGESSTSAFLTGASSVGKGIVGEITLSTPSEQISGTIQGRSHFNDVAAASNIELGIGPGGGTVASSGVKWDGTLITLYKFQNIQPQIMLGDQSSTSAVKADATNVIVNYRVPN